MVQSFGERMTRNDGSTVSSGIDRPSNESRKQREGIGTTGAFGQRSGSSDLLFLEGVLPERDGNVLNTHSIDEQTVACLDRLEAMLDRRGATLENVMKVEVQLTDLDVREAVDEVYRARFDGEFPPRTTVGVCSLPGGAGIQLDVVAAEE
ncbi:RidA family protein [Halalkalicoccus jeotgali]|uniref:Endoribonuclease L-PSP n=1 Tax=Halalkalicoccus jeotgali (strain DSM 18796 / CECT 7217 / JCM 14584 / KCTC 4019 / B3) TaxID=795797 RepID=D8JAM4_HALJB|nr:RidA family protein [Halalkalicoccus jeotgali]ADJ14746.1 endoribonuclease L-PSP [Halalkalicoccus jeotgali B3]ELY39328.1 endoribonuclease L-PSP [Halalkalicoccus jeotgali B3]